MPGLETVDQAASIDELRVETAATPVDARSGRESWDATIVECSVQHGVVGVHDMLRSADRLVDTAATLSRRYALEEGGGGGHNRHADVTEASLGDVCACLASHMLRCDATPMMLASFRYLLKASKDAFQRQAGEMLRACIVALPGLGHDDMLVAWHTAQAGQHALAANRRNL
ncbi:hypothetical protein MY4038_006545 [Beauveria bassiana]